MPTTFDYLNNTYTAIYYDNSNPINGTGETPDSPINTIPQINNISGGTALIFRRTGIPAPPIRANINYNNQIIFCGSPKETDHLYTVIPSSNVWKDDPSPYFTFNITGNQSIGGINFRSYNIVVDRIQIIQAVTSGPVSASCGILSVGANSTIRNCSISCSGASYENENTLGGIIPSIIGIRILGSYTNIIDSDINIFGDAAIYYEGSFAGSLINNSIIKIFSSYGGTVFALRYGGTQLKLNITSCQISGKNYTYGETLLYAGAYSIDGIISNSIFHSARNVSTQFSCIDNNVTTSDILHVNNTYSVGRITNNTTNGILRLAGKHIFKNCLFQTPKNIGSGAIYIIYGDGSTSTSYSYLNCIFSGDGIIGYNGIPTNNTVFSNCQFLSGMPMLDSQLYIPNARVPKNGYINIRGNGILYTNNLDISASNKSIQLYDNAKLFIDTANYDLLSTGLINFNASSNAAIYIKNNNNILGNWVASSLNALMTTSNTYRQGGTNYSIKCEGLPPTSYTPLYIAPYPFNGMPLNFGSSGNKKVTLYIAYKLYTSSVSLNDIAYDIEIPNIDGTYKILNGSGRSIIKNDSSTWINDTGLTTKKIETYFNMPVSGNIYYRIYFQKYTIPTNGYLLLDPVMIGEDL